MHKKEQNKKAALFGFPSSTEPTGVIVARDLVIDMDGVFHACDNGYTPKV